MDRTFEANMNSHHHFKKRYIFPKTVIVCKHFDKISRSSISQIKIRNEATGDMSSG